MSHNVIGNQFWLINILNLVDIDFDLVKLFDAIKCVKPRIFDNNYDFFSVFILYNYYRDFLPMTNGQIIIIIVLNYVNGLFIIFSLHHPPSFTGKTVYHFVWVFFSFFYHLPNCSIKINYYLVVAHHIEWFGKLIL